MLVSKTQGNSVGLSANLSPNGFGRMTNLILNSFPVEVSPSKLSLPFVEFDSWEASTLGRRNYPRFRTYRYEHRSNPEFQSSGRACIRLVLLSGPPAPPETQADEMDISSLPKLCAVLIEHSLSDHLESQGMTIRRSSFERLALRRVETQSSQLVHLYSGISFKARRPFRAQPYSFTLSVQWVASAIFVETLASAVLRDIARGLGVLYTPKNKASPELLEFENRFLGHVRDVPSPDETEVICRDDVRRAIPVQDLTLEASSEALRRYEVATGSQQQPSRVWRRLQQLSKVLTAEGRRNPVVLRDRLNAIRGVLGGFSKEQLVLPLKSYVDGAVSIGLEPLRVELS